MLAQTTSLVPATQSDPVPVAVSRTLPRPATPAPAAAGVGPPGPRRIPTRRPSWPAQHQVSRQFLYRQADTARLALEHAFDPPPPAEEVLFHLPVTTSWLRQLILALVLSCHSPYRGVIALLGDLFDTQISLGTVHNIGPGRRRAGPRDQRLVRPGRSPRRGP